MHFSNEKNKQVELKILIMAHRWQICNKKYLLEKNPPLGRGETTIEEISSIFLWFDISFRCWGFKLKNGYWDTMQKMDDKSKKLVKSASVSHDQDFKLNLFCFSHWKTCQTPHNWENIMCLRVSWSLLFLAKQSMIYVAAPPLSSF